MKESVSGSSSGEVERDVLGEGGSEILSKYFLIP
jgi:hypothetical protein